MRCAINVLLAGVVVFAAVVSCATNTTTTEQVPRSSGPAPCSNGPPYSLGTTLPHESPTGQAVTTQCTPHCKYDGRRGPNNSFAIDALPTGTCNGEGDACGMAMYDGCATQGVTCSCSNGNWRCVITSTAQTVCPDGGVNYFTDAGATDAGVE